VRKPKPDIVQRLLDWAQTICTVNDHVPPSSKAQMARDAAEEIKRLRAELAKATAERDEARRLFCKLHAGVEAVGYAEARGWNCFYAEGNKTC
jgi:phage protein D